MKTRRLGQVGLEVSALGLGCMGMSWAYGQPSSETEATRTLHEAIALGMTFLDTAEVYGPYHNEALLGRALRNHRDSVTLATKVGFDIDADASAEDSVKGVNGRPEHIIAATEASLKRLGVETIDLLYQHRPDPSVPVEESVGAMAQLVTQGKVRYLGLSEVSADLLKRACAVHPISALQSEYSLWYREVEDNILPMCRALGVGFVPYSPLGRGFLTGSITQADTLSDNDFRRSLPRFQKEAMAQNLKLVDTVKALAADRGCTAAQLALAWLLDQGEDIVPIPGARRLDHLRDNAAAADIVLGDVERHTLDALLKRTRVVGERYGANVAAYNRPNR